MTATPSSPPPALRVAFGKRFRFLRRGLDRLIAGLSVSGVILMFVLLALIFLVLLHGAWMAVVKVNWHFFTSAVWDPVAGHDHYGVLAFVYGTAITTFIALLLAIPMSIGVAVFIVRIAPRWLSGPISFLVELLAAIPSVVYGLWGAFIMSPWLQNNLEMWIWHAMRHLDFIPVGHYRTGHYVNGHFVHDIAYFPSNLVHGGPSGTDYLAGGLILAIMILPIITAITRDVLQQFPKDLEESTYAMGATWWQTTRVALNYCRVGIFGAAMLGMARAIGETMAIIMVIGNTDRLSASIFAGGQTLTGIFVNQFLSADRPIWFSAMMYVGVTLLVSTFLVTLAARLMLNRLQASRA